METIQYCIAKFKKIIMIGQIKVAEKEMNFVKVAYPNATQ